MNQRIQAHPANEVLLAHSYQDNNRIDNAVEYILEVWMAKKNAIPEDKHPKQDHSFHAKNLDFKVVVPRYQPMEPAFLYVSQLVHFPKYKFYSYRFSTKINPPPPKA